METKILIVGAGPVGLGMAIELGNRGIDCVVVDRGDGTIEHPRTGLVAIRTMEAFRQWGIAANVRACGFPEDYDLSMVFCTSLNGLVLDREAYPSMRDAPTPPETPEKKQRCPQLWLQPIMARAAMAHPNVTMLYSHEYIDYSENGEGITATVKNLENGKTRAIAASYLLACDGATSLAREQAGIAMNGRLLSYSVNILFRCPALAKKHLMGEAERYMFVGPEGMWGNITVVDGDEIWRLTVLGSEEKMNLDGFDARAWILRALGTENDPGQIPFEIESVIPWRRTEMLAESYKKGRVILVGDSAHTMSPTGGMGMNTGIQEVLDLGRIRICWTAMKSNAVQLLKETSFFPHRISRPGKTHRTRKPCLMPPKKANGLGLHSASGCAIPPGWSGNRWACKSATGMKNRPSAWPTARRQRRTISVNMYRPRAPVHARRTIGWKTGARRWTFSVTALP